jgi:hypothetical protein
MDAHVHPPGLARGKSVPRGPRYFVLFLFVVVAAWVLHGAVFWAGEARRIDAALSPTSARLSVPNAGRNLFLDNDSAYWAIHARDLIEQGGWRIRHTKADNAPDRVTFQAESPIGPLVT